MITKTANDYLLKEAGLGEDIKKKWDEFQAWRTANRYTFGNALSKLPFGSEKIQKDLAEKGFRNFVSEHGAKRLAELNALKDQLVAKAKAGAGHVGRFANDVGRGYKDLYNYLGTKAHAAKGAIGDAIAGADSRVAKGLNFTNEQLAKFQKMKDVAEAKAAAATAKLQEAKRVWLDDNAGYEDMNRAFE